MMFHRTILVAAVLAAPLVAHAEPAKLELKKVVVFDDNKTYVHTESRYALQALARLWKENHAWTKITIEGNAWFEDEETAIALGQRRADAVKTWLVRFGIDAKYVEAVGDSRHALGDGAGRYVDIVVEACGVAGTDCRGK